MTWTASFPRNFHPEAEEVPYAKVSHNNFEVFCHILGDNIFI